METFGGRRTAAGQWVAYGPAGEIEAAVATHEVIELVTPDGNVPRVTLARAGHAFQINDEPIAYGYPIPADEENVA